MKYQRMRGPFRPDAFGSVVCLSTEKGNYLSLQKCRSNTNRTHRTESSLIEPLNGVVRMQDHKPKQLRVNSAQRNKRLSVVPT